MERATLMNTLRLKTARDGKTNWRRVVLLLGLAFVVTSCGGEPDAPGDSVVLETAEKKTAPAGNEETVGPKIDHPMNDYFVEHTTKLHPFPIKIADKPKPEKIPAWWENPVPLTDEELGYQRYFSAISWQLDKADWPRVWDTKNDRVGNSDRFFASFAGYAAAAIAMRTPAYPGLIGRQLVSFIDHILAKQTWKYVSMFWRKQPWYPDPVAHQNIMISGHLLELMALYEMYTGDDVYRTKGFDFVWDEENRFHYDLMSLTEVTVRQIRDNESGGVCCEPGIIFFACNDHQHIAFKIMEGMGLGDWSAERRKWEQWALKGFYDNLGGGAMKIGYHQTMKEFSKIGYPGMDGWSLVYYQPWAEDPEVPNSIWRLARRTIRWNDFTLRPGKKKRRLRGQSTFISQVYNTVQQILAPAPTASFLYAAAAACDDKPTAARLRKLLNRQYRIEDNGRIFLGLDKKVQIGSTGNMALGLAYESGSNMRHLVQRPLPRSYLKGPLIEEVLPETANVYQAYRDGRKLVVEIGHKGETTLRFRNVARVRKVEGLDKDKWRYEDGLLHVQLDGRKQFTIFSK
jgi:linalool dehydratase/isomerase-like protein